MSGGHAATWIVGAIVGAGLLVGCGSSGGSDAGSSPATERSTTTSTTSAQSSAAGAPITDPVCEFLGLEARAAAVLPYPVTLTSGVGANDPTGGSCDIESTTGEPTISVAAFPMARSEFEPFVDRYTAKLGPTGNRLWTDPEPVDGVGDEAVTFKAPTGGWDAVFVFADGYRIMVSDRAEVDVPGRVTDLRNLATEIVKYRQAWS